MFYNDYSFFKLCDEIFKLFTNELANIFFGLLVILLDISITEFELYC